MKALVKNFRSLVGASFVGIHNYVNSHGEIANITLLTNINIENAKRKDLETLQNVTDEDLKTLSNEIKIPFDICQKALNELVKSAEKNLNDELSKRSINSQAQTDSYVKFEGIKGVKMHLETKEVFVYGFQQAKKVIVSGVYPTVNSQRKTIAKNAIKKHCDLRMLKFRQYKVGKIDELAINGNIINL